MYCSVQMRSLPLVGLLLCIAAVSAAGGRHFAEGEDVPILVNTVSPYSNPSETYEYYSLPFCRPDPMMAVKVTLGQAIEGDRYFNSIYSHKFKVAQENVVACEVHLNATDVNKFRKAISKYFFYSMVVDAMQMHGFIGTVEHKGEEDLEGNSLEKDYIFTHLHFTFLYNGDQLIFANTTADISHAVLLNQDEGVDLKFTYTSEWKSTDISFRKRNSLFKPFVYHEMEIHWLSIMNNVVLVILLSGLLILIVFRTIRKDYYRYSQSVELEEDSEEDYGWKQVHGDVFRFPSMSSYLCAFLGIGSQLLIVTTSLQLLSLIGLLYPEQSGSIYSTFIALFSLASAVSGMVSANMYKKMNGEKWSWNIVLAASLFALPVGTVFTVSDLVSRLYGSTSALPIVKIIEICAIWLIVSLPLTIIGGIAGRRLSGSFDAPVRTKNAVREIPPIPFYRSRPFQIMVAGFLPFSAIYTELYYIEQAIWGHSYYNLYGILFLVFFILLIVTACITISLVYFQLSAEDHRWWWQSFINGGSTALFVFGYSLFYFFFRSSMYGVVQTVKFFSFSLITCYLLFVMLGTVGFVCSLWFVKTLYTVVKVD